MSDLAPVFMGSVNRWECDENDHLNVRFFAQKMFQTLQSGLLEAGLAPADAGATGDRIRSVHMRYIAEARIAAPLTGCFGVVGSGSTTHHVVTELRHTTTGNLMASYLFEIEHLLPPGAETIEKPEGAGGRGLPERCSDYIRLSLDDARQRGFSVIGQGVIQPEECDASGRLLFFQYIGRTSDSIPNLWAKLEGASSRGEGMLG
ncbi:MAG: hypothetical protein O3B72_10755, partial [Proteobacteria bacterium]|nr:hypothetical protein [Pseudomonadota bacterium]